MARQPVLVRMTKTKITSQEFNVRVELEKTYEVSETDPHIRSKTSKPTKENDESKGGREKKTRKMARTKIINLPLQPLCIWLVWRGWFVLGSFFLCTGLTGEDRAEGARFWHAFLTPFWGPQKICFFKRNDAEAYVWPKSDTRQAQQNIVQSTNVCEVKRHMTKQKPTK